MGLSVVILAALTLVGSGAFTEGVASAGSTLSITPTTLLGATIGLPYSATLSATGGSPPYRWKFAPHSIKLPAGLKLNKATGTISGTPRRRAVSTTFTVEVLDSTRGRTRDTATETLRLTIGGTGSLQATAIAVGDFSDCALLPDETVNCWGENAVGQLGNGTTLTSAIPVPVSGLTGVTALAGGAGNTCALLTGGTVDCWGVNGYGELGDGTLLGSSTPVPVSGLTGVSAIAGGQLDNCALLTGGTVDCWGGNVDGSLGNGSSLVYSSTPVAVTDLTGVRAIAAGPANDNHTCAVLAGGTVDCWGRNVMGELGNGTTTNSSIPVPVTGLTGVTAIAAGDSDTCALLTGGTVDCWGWNSAGQLGNGTTTNSSIPVPVTGLTGVTAIAAGYAQNCAVLAGGTVDCWGFDSQGQLGNGIATLTPQTTPVAVTGLSGAAAVVGAGQYSTCAVLAGDTVDCWGRNNEGELGNGTLGPEMNGYGPLSTTPVVVVHQP